MNIFRRLTPFLSSIALFALFEWLISQPSLFWGIGAVVVTGGIAASALVGRSEVRGGRWHFALLAGLYVVSALGFLVLLDTTTFQHLHSAMAAGLWWLWIEQLYRFHYLPGTYIPFSVANVTSLVTVVTAFYLFSTAFALKLLLGYPFWLLTVLVGLAGTLFAIEIIWSEKLSPWRFWSMPMTIGLVVAELFWALNYLPAGYFVNGLIVTVMLYLSVNLGRFALKRALQPAVVKRYLLIAALMLLLVLLSARWI